MPSLRIVIADDHPLVRAAVGHSLQDWVVGGALVEAPSFSALAAVLEQQAELDLVLLDLNMPGAKGFSSLIYLRGERPELPVIVISSNDHPRTVAQARQFGAAGFVSKAAPVAEMQAAVQAVMDGGESFPEVHAERRSDDAELAARLAQLTPQQFRVLMCMADGLLNKQIAYELGLAENTVKVHISAILRKLGCHGRTQAAVLVKALEPEAVQE